VVNALLATREESWALVDYRCCGRSILWQETLLHGRGGRNVEVLAEGLALPPPGPSHESYFDVVTAWVELAPHEGQNAAGASIVQIRTRG
jgi:hypothetical protein